LAGGSFIPLEKKVFLSHGVKTGIKWRGWQSPTQPRA
jgi:hypothetical protein